MLLALMLIITQTNYLYFERRFTTFSELVDNHNYIMYSSLNRLINNAVNKIKVTYARATGIMNANIHHKQQQFKETRRWDPSFLCMFIYLVYLDANHEANQ